MARKTPPTTTKPAPARTQGARQTITLELVVAIAPHEGLAQNLSRTFGLEMADYDSIRDTTEEQVGLSAKALAPALNEKAMQIHLQRIIGAFVGSAYGAATFYSNKVSEARQLTAASANDNRDEDRDGPAGFESKAERARRFAAEMGMQAYALRAAAEGAVSAYEDVTGETWKAYEPPTSPANSVQRRSATAELDAFGS